MHVSVFQCFLLLRLFNEKNLSEKRRVPMTLWDLQRKCGDVSRVTRSLVSWKDSRGILDGCGEKLANDSMKLAKLK